MTDKIRISFDSFIDFTLKPDSLKPSLVRSLQSGAFSLRQDYWKPVKEIITEVVFGRKSIKRLYSMLDQVPNECRVNYSRAVSGFDRFIAGSGDAACFVPPKAFWVKEDLIVSVDPELGIVINGIPYIIKLYFKEYTDTREVRINKERAMVSVQMMTDAFECKISNRYRMSLLNVATGQLLTPRTNGDMTVALNCSTNTLITMWKALSGCDIQESIAGF
ncbi:MAG: hypothetical protein P4N59_19890 [Negativicutes bacterium]|nr:hypothetical protein [Negativicutes bacterium]